MKRTGDVVDLRMEGLGRARLVHRGPLSSLYRAQQLRFNREVAVKVFAGRNLDEHAAARFARECELMGILSAHPNVITVFDSAVVRRRPILVSEWLGSGTFSDRVRRDGPLDWREAAAVGIKLAGALETAHRLGVLHRNLKLQNVMVSAFGEPLLTDFEVLGDSGVVTRSADTYDRLVHAPPEQWRGGEPSAAAEVYALASMTVELLRGLPAFVLDAEHDALVEVAARASAGHLPDLAALGAPPPLVDVLTAALAPEPGARPPSAHAFGGLLQAVQLQEGQMATPLLVQPETEVDRAGTTPPPPVGPQPVSSTAPAGPPAAEAVPDQPVEVRPRPLLDEVRVLLDQALEVCVGSVHGQRLEAIRAGLDEPLRVAIAGKVKAGKSTLLNALVGEELAPTDASECTQVVTWYRDSHTYRATVHPCSGPPRQLPFARRSGAIELDLDGLAPHEVDRLVIDWPSSSLRRLTLIDTPGLDSVSAELSERSTRFVLAGDSHEGPADAVLYLMRHLHRSDLQFLEAFHHSEVTEPAPINAIGILSRADEVGVGRPDALESARQVAARYRSDPQLRRLCQTVVPVAGLLASSGATLRQEEFAALHSLTALGSGLEELLLSADRFVALEAPVDARVRADLLERFGVFGIRLATTLLGRGAVTSAPELSSALVAQSGLVELRDLLLTRFAARRDVLKARAALAAIDTAIVESTGGARDDLIAAVERVKAGAHEVTETQLLSEHRAGELVFRPDEEEEVDRLLGLDGPEPTVRLGLDPDAGPDEIRARLEDCIQRWRRRSEHPLTSRDVAEAARVLVRSCEGMLADLGAVGAPG